jgi:ankyrin repeat protein
MQMLLKYVVDVDVKDDERTALHWAAENGHEAEVRLLLKHKVDVDAKTVSRRSQQVKPCHQTGSKLSYGRRI